MGRRPIVTVWWSIAAPWLPCSPSQWITHHKTLHGLTSTCKRRGWEGEGTEEKCETHTNTQKSHPVFGKCKTNEQKDDVLWLRVACLLCECLNLPGLSELLTNYPLHRCLIEIAPTKISQDCDAARSDLITLLPPPQGISLPPKTNGNEVREDGKEGPDSLWTGSKALTHHPRVADLVCSLPRRSDLPKTKSAKPNFLSHLLPSAENITPAASPPFILHNCCGHSCHGALASCCVDAPSRLSHDPLGKKQLPRSKWLASLCPLFAFFRCGFFHSSAMTKHTDFTVFLNRSSSELFIQGSESMCTSLCCP